jgi:STE24 endopeptidase
MNPYLLFILAVLIARYLLETCSDVLNLRHVSPILPAEFEGHYDANRYAKSQDYLGVTTQFGLLIDLIHTVVTIAFILLGGFAFVDAVARKLASDEILCGLAFAGILALAGQLLALPFSIYRTFVIEERFGFNRTTPRTFVVDTIKSLILAAVIGGPVLAGVIWFFLAAGPLAWMYCWIAVVLFQVVLVFIAPYVIMPLFNKYTPLEEGDLRSAIENYAAEQDFRMKGVFQMDGSRRSSKSNAFFTGFGKSRRIVLYDTLIKNHDVDELLAVVAHEMGHYKRHHVLKAMGRGIITSGIMFFLLSLFMKNEGMFQAFGIESAYVSIYASLVFFGFLYAPIATGISVFENILSRNHEFEADAYAARTTGKSEAMIAALKRLTVDNLGNLNPHPFKVFLDYSHPPVLKRIQHLESL